MANEKFEESKRRVGNILRKDSIQEKEWKLMEQMFKLNIIFQSFVSVKFLVSILPDVDLEKLVDVSKESKRNRTAKNIGRRKMCQSGQ